MKAVTISVHIRALHSSDEEAGEEEDEKGKKSEHAHAAVENKVCQCVTLTNGKEYGWGGNKAAAILSS